VTAVVHGDQWQAVLLDLPGFQRPGDGLTVRMQATVDVALEDVDGALLVLNSEEAIGGGDRFIAERLRATGTPTIVVVNKVDKRKPGQIAEFIASAAELVDFVALHPVSAMTGDGLEALRDGLVPLLSPGPAYFPEDMTTDQTEQELAAELIREAALVRVRDEIPHALAVEIEAAEESSTGFRLAASIIVETESQKRIVVGKGGQMVRDIGASAREELGRLWSETVHLSLHVKVRKRWRDDESLLDRLGV
jgi:GTP-binding protein Era